MSEEHASTMTATEDSPGIETATQTPEADFQYDELQQFDADDVTAGSALCKMLSLFFFYTVIVMTIAGVWTLASISK